MAEKFILHGNAFCRLTVRNLKLFLKDNMQVFFSLSCFWPESFLQGNQRKLLIKKKGLFINTDKKLMSVKIIKKVRKRYGIFEM